MTLVHFRKDNIMQITRQTEYAIRIILELSKYPENETISSKILSERQEIPEEFLKKTVQILSLAGLVTTQRGIQGGVRLAKHPEEITIADIITAIEGPVAMNVCLAPGNDCPNKKTCVISPVMARAQLAFLRELSRENMAELAKKSI